MQLRIKKILLWLLSSLTRWLWRLIVLITIVVAVVISAGRELAPLLHQHKDWLEASLTASIGEEVAMQQVDAYWEGLVPELLVKNLSIGDALQIDSALMRVDLLSSALSLSPVFETLHVNYATVVIPVGDISAAKTFNFRFYREFFLGSADINARNLEIVLQQSPESSLTLHVDEFKVRNDRQEHWLSGAISINSQKNINKKDPVKIILKYKGDSDNVFMGRGSAYIDFGDDKNLAQLLQFMQQLPAQSALERITSVDQFRGRVWASWRDERIEWVSETVIKGLTFAERQAPAYAIDFSGRLAGYVLTKDMLAWEYFIHTLPDQQLVINQRPYPLPVLGVQYTDKRLAGVNSLLASASDSEHRCRVYLPDLDLAQLGQYLELLPSPGLRRSLKTLNPGGRLENVLLTLPLPVADTPTLAPMLQARLKGVSVSAWQGAPALRSLDGYLQSSATSGFVDVDSRDGFSMHYKTLYHRAMQYNSARGRVHWNIHPVNKHIYVGSDDLELYAGDGELRGSFWLDLPPSTSQQVPELYIQAGLENSQVKYRNKYLPYTLDAGLRDWLASSLKGGDMNENGFIYRGTLSANDKQNQTTLFYSKAKKVRLQFDPAWPVLRDLNVLVQVNNDTVTAESNSGVFLETRLSNAAVEVKPSSNGNAHFLTLQADASGPGSDILSVMRDTPLRETFGNVFDGWQLQGDSSGHLNLGLQIGAAAETPYQEIDLTLKDNDLLVGKINLPIEALNGKVHYSSSNGLLAEQLNARLWQREQNINITPVSDGDGLPDILLSLSGKIDPDAAARWTHLPFLHFLKGDMPVLATLAVPLDTATVDGPVAVATLQSDLKGVVIDLPEPFKKSLNKTLASELGIELWKDKQIYKMQYGQLMTAAIEQASDGKLKGDVVINQHDRSSSELPDHLRVLTQLDQVTLSDWLPVMDDYKAFTKADTEAYQKQLKNHAAESTATESAYPVFDIVVKQLSIGSLKLDDIRLMVDYQLDKTAGNYWNIAFENTLMAGRYHFFDDVNKLPEVDFDVVRLGEEKKSEAEQEAAVAEEDDKRIDPLADVIPQDLPAMSVHVKHLWLQGSDVGDWRFTVNPDEQGVVLEDLYVSTQGLQIRGLEQDRGAMVHWTRTGDHINTEVFSKISLSKQQGAQNLFGVERIIEAEKTDFQGRVNWKGSPAMMSFARLQGELTFVSEKGRFLNSTASTDIMRVINVFNFSTWARRLKLDFSDLYKSGVSFDKVSAQAQLDRGKLTLEKPLVMVGPSGRFELKGVIDSAANVIDASLIVTLPVNSNAAWIAALAAGLPVAAGVWAVSKVFGNQIDKLSSVNYAISGTLDEPTVKFVGLLPELSEAVKNRKPVETTAPLLPETPPATPSVP